MKASGYILLIVGFLAGARVAVQTIENELNWRLFLPALVAAALGVGLARTALRRESRHEDAVAANLRTVETSLESIANNIEKLDADKESIEVHDLSARIDELFMRDINSFVEARESISHQFGLQSYADVMSDFAVAERYLNRVWSASIDGYVDEAREYVTRSKEQFLSARRRLGVLLERGTTPA